MKPIKLPTAPIKLIAPLIITGAATENFRNNLKTTIQDGGESYANRRGANIRISPPVRCW